MKGLLCAMVLSIEVLGNTLVVGSKAFTEGFILAELAAQVLEGVPNVEITRRFGMGGTGILFQALISGEIMIYPEYTGTVAEAILKNKSLRDFEKIQEGLKPLNLVMSQPLGFNNTYAMGVRDSFAKTHNLSKVSDLRSLASTVRAGFSTEFMTRSDGFQQFSRSYGLKLKNVKSMEHALTYDALEKGFIDIIDVYSTDAKIEKLKLKILEDDLEYFPKYEAIFLASKQFVESHPIEWMKLNSLAGKITEDAMISLNAKMDIEKRSRAQVVSEFLGAESEEGPSEAIMERVLFRTKEHLTLVLLSLSVSILFGVPLGILAFRNKGIGQIILVITSMFQTIPSLALLCFLIPIFGIGETPALVALCLYGLLPVVLNTYIGLKNIDPKHIENSIALGLSSFQTLRYIQLPLARISILGGIKTSAIIGIGTATLAALIGAGGYGVPIVTGLAINDTSTILMGAVPAAALALLTHVFFSLLERHTDPTKINAEL